MGDKMQREVECTTQAELDACVKAGNIALVFSGHFEVSGNASVTAYGSSSVTACGSSSVRAYDGSSVRAYDGSSVRACGSSSVTACGSSSVRAYDGSSVTAYDGSSVRAYGSSSVTACGSSSVTACGNSSVRATGNAFIRLLSALKITASISVVVMAHTSDKVIEGGQVVCAAIPKTAEEWCDLHGVEVVDGVATLYKALNEDFTSPHGMSYAPGSTPVAPDWDNGKAECGGGLHFSPSAAQARSFHDSAKRFTACYVRLSDMRGPKEGDQYPEKAKAKGCCAPCIEVDINGNVIAQKVAA